jgi:predicted N-acetyltransferase YhbS
MKFRHHAVNDSQAIVALFTSVFTESEGAAEGELIGRLARDLLEKTSEQDLFNFVADDDGRIVGSIFFSRLDFGNGVEAFILAPVAVQGHYQGKGIGRALIDHGLGELRDRGISLVLTYGDPGFYSKVGFRKISHQAVQAPFELTQPEGWLGQSLVGDPIETLAGRCTCVEALNNPAFW